MAKIIIWKTDQGDVPPCGLVAKTPMLPEQGAQVQFLVKELDPKCPN